MKLAIYSRKLNSSEKQTFARYMFRYLIEQEIEFCVSSELEDIAIEYDIKEIYHNNFELISSMSDFIISLGGDGTILDTVVLAKGALPVLGINLGRLGFLSSVERNKFEDAINKLQNGKYKIDKRMLLEVNSNIPIFVNENIALNDLTFLRSNTSSMIEVKVFINGEFINNYFADGLIVSTSTGSTGYSLSCGGPILYPNNNSFILTPIAPHNLNVRPIVISDQELLTFEIKGRTPDFLCTLDSRLSYITSKHKISIKRSNIDFQLAVINDNYFNDALKNKLNWGNR